MFVCQNEGEGELSGHYSQQVTRVIFPSGFAVWFFFFGLRLSSMEFSASGSREFEFYLLEFPTFGSVKPLDTLRHVQLLCRYRIILNIRRSD
jgi:hypothetical protein